MHVVSLLLSAQCPCQAELQILEIMT